MHALKISVDVTTSIDYSRHHINYAMRLPYDEKKTSKNFLLFCSQTT